MILVTGASGFLGNHLLKELIKFNLPIRALYHRTLPNIQHSNIEWVKCNLFDVVALENVFLNIKQVYHCAAVVSFDSKKKHQMIHDNVLITANIVNAALNEGVDNFIHVSSVAALGRSLKDDDSNTSVFIDENSPWEENKHNSAYAKSKYLSELEVWRGIAEGLPAAIVNPALILGEGDWSKGSAHLFKIVDQEFPWFTEGINAWVDVKDVVKAMILLMENPLNGQRFILSCGNYSFKDVFTKMAVKLGKRPPHRRAGKWMTEIVWRLELIKSRIAGKEATISKETANTAQNKCFYNADKFLKCFPDFKYHSLEDTIERMQICYIKP